MKKNLFVLIILLIFCGFACNQISGSGKIISQERKVSDFKKVALSGSGELIIAQGLEEGLTVEAEDNIMKFVITEVKAKTLRLGLKEVSWPKSIRPTKPIIYKIKLIDLTKIKVSGAGAVYAKSIQTQDLEVDISGSGKITVDQIAARNLAIDLSGSGDFTLAGKVEKQTINISGSGNYRAPALYSRKAKIKISGSGNAVIRVEKSLYVRVSGSGKIEYYGQPRITQDISGSGRIRNIGQ